MLSTDNKLMEGGEYSGSSRHRVLCQATNFALPDVSITESRARDLLEVIKKLSKVSQSHCVKFADITSATHLRHRAASELLSILHRKGLVSVAMPDNHSIEDVKVALTDTSEFLLV